MIYRLIIRISETYAIMRLLGSIKNADLCSVYYKYAQEFAAVHFDLIISFYHEIYRTHVLIFFRVAWPAMGQSLPIITPVPPKYPCVMRKNFATHYRNVIISVLASQITGVSIVHSTVCSGTDQRKKIKAPRHWPLWGEFTSDSEFPAQRAGNAENVSIWWRRHG